MLSILRMRRKRADVYTQLPDSFTTCKLSRCVKQAFAAGEDKLFRVFRRQLLDFITVGNYIVQFGRGSTQIRLCLSSAIIPLADMATTTNNVEGHPVEEQPMEIATEVQDQFLQPQQT